MDIMLMDPVQRVRFIRGYVECDFPALQPYRDLFRRGTLLDIEAEELFTQEFVSRSISGELVPVETRLLWDRYMSGSRGVLFCRLHSFSENAFLFQSLGSQWRVSGEMHDIPFRLDSNDEYFPLGSLSLVASLDNLMEDNVRLCEEDRQIFFDSFKVFEPRSIKGKCAVQDGFVTVSKCNSPHPFCSLNVATPAILDYLEDEDVVMQLTEESGAFTEFTYDELPYDHVYLRAVGVPEGVCAVSVNTTTTVRDKYDPDYVTHSLEMVPASEVDFYDRVQDHKSPVTLLGSQFDVTLPRSLRLVTEKKDDFSYIMSDLAPPACRQINGRWYPTCFYPMLMNAQHREVHVPYCFPSSVQLNGFFKYRGDSRFMYRPDNANDPIFALTFDVFGLPAVYSFLTGQLYRLGKSFITMLCCISFMIDGCRELLLFHLLNSYLHYPLPIQYDTSMGKIVSGGCGIGSWTISSTFSCCCLPCSQTNSQCILTDVKSKASHTNLPSYLDGLFSGASRLLIEKSPLFPILPTNVFIGDGSSFPRELASRGIFFFPGCFVTKYAVYVNSCFDKVYGKICASDSSFCTLGSVRSMLSQSGARGLLLEGSRQCGSCYQLFCCLRTIGIRYLFSDAHTDDQFYSCEVFCQEFFFRSVSPRSAVLPVGYNPGWPT